MSEKNKVEPYHLNRKWKTITVNFQFDKPIDRSNILDLIHIDRDALYEQHGAVVMVITTQPGFDEWNESLLAYHGFDKTANEEAKK